MTIEYFLRSSKIQNVDTPLRLPQLAPTDYGRVGVLYGGDSPERVVSLDSGRMVYEALLARGIEAVLIDTQYDAVSAIQQAEIDRAFIALHGADGENGAVQGLLTYLNIPFTGSNSSSCAFAMDKLRCKLIWNSLHLPIPVFGMANTEADLKDISKTIHAPWCVKPNDGGSSLGVSRAENLDELIAGFHQAKQYCDAVLIEQWYDGYDYTVSVLNQTALPAIKIIPKQKFYDYEAKYVGGTDYECPANITSAQAKHLAEVALVAYNSLGCSQWGRVDFVRDKAGKFWLLEVNTVPGLTTTSLVPKAAQMQGLDYADLILSILSLTVKQTAMQNKVALG